jgi:uracil-DNA glycosylase
MSIQYCDGGMPTSKSDVPDNDEFLCIFPSIGLKKCGQYESWLSEFYTKYPHSDYYGQHDSTGKRANPGTFVKYSPTREAPGIINLYIKVYPGTKTYPNDNSALRIKNFSSAFSALADQQGIRKLHIMIPSKITDEQREYLQHLDDFLASCQLHGSGPTICIYGCNEPIERAKQMIGRPPTKQKINLEKKIPTSAPVFKLEFDDSQLSGVVLYEADFVKGKVRCDRDLINRLKAGVLQYFSDPAGKWSRLLDDTKLQKEGERIQEKIGNIIGTDVFPSPSEIFNAFQYLDPEVEPKVVIIGQDPYHGPGQAHGLSFSVKKGVAVPPSLRNIYSALENDPNVHFKRPNHGCLEDWARQGVIMLNASLTVLKGQAGSHKDVWEVFTDRLIQLLSIKYPGLIYVLWGNDARKKNALINGKDHIVLEFNHPSPMVRNNTFGTECRHFSQINQHLMQKGKTPINWQLNPVFIDGLG